MWRYRAKSSNRQRELYIEAAARLVWLGAATKTVRLYGEETDGRPQQQRRVHFEMASWPKEWASLPALRQWRRRPNPAWSDQPRRTDMTMQRGAFNAIRLE